jgi:hypothetical protein
VDKSLPRNTVNVFQIFSVVGVEIDVRDVVGHMRNSFHCFSDSARLDLEDGH